MARRISIARTTRIEIPTDLSPDAIIAISTALRQYLADVFGLYLKTGNFHCHKRGPSVSRLAIAAG